MGEPNADFSVPADVALGVVRCRARPGKMGHLGKGRGCWCPAARGDPAKEAQSASAEAGSERKVIFGPPGRELRECGRL